MIKFFFLKNTIAFFLSTSALIISCNNNSTDKTSNVQTQNNDTGSLMPISEPLISKIYTADPSAHVFEGKIYIYPSHDIEAGIPENDKGDHFAMTDYHILSMDSINGKVTDHGVGLDIKNIPWAHRQLWAPDAAYSNGTYYLYFPVKDKKDVFHIGVATGSSPAGPFKPQPKPIPGSFSIDPGCFSGFRQQLLHVLWRPLGRATSALAFREI